MNFPLTSDTQRIKFSSLEEDDIEEVIKIQAKNQKHDIPSSDFKDVGRGHLSWKSTEEALRATLDKERSIVAKDVQGKIIAFLLTVDLENAVPSLFSQEIRSSVEQLLAINNGKIISHKVCCGQIWADARYFKEAGKSYLDEKGHLISEIEAMDVVGSKKVSEAIYDVFFNLNSHSENPYRQRIAVVLAQNGQSYNFHIRHVGYRSLGLEKFEYENEKGNSGGTQKHIMVRNLPV